MRSYAKYLRQAGFPYSQSHIESVLNENPHTAGALIALFEALFDPDPSGSPKTRDAQAAAAAVTADIDALVSLDTDRVLRAFASLIQATLRTNYFVTRAGSARSQDVLALKLDAPLIDELPEPRPKFEIFVYSPRVEGVHLRFGHVARGDCAGRIVGKISAPRSSVWSRHKQSRTPSSCQLAPRAASSSNNPADHPRCHRGPRRHPQRRHCVLQAVHLRIARRHRQRRPHHRQGQPPTRGGAT
ncbi:bacterial NAD-glutamate dehydrogenase family protein [Mycobacterium xenopi 4042]|uniref:Bacterial NAD-glutamate dehydrogenase family protein n=1 Tax=Mycobacterium xenopi 4042 TaxID=1299334 RepID=X8AQ30_MYCXE|nr:bacterial NAD-glutamate dehydrogenase family protein [Mycobacterium xenopi 4042]